MRLFRIESENVTRDFKYALLVLGTKNVAKNQHETLVPGEGARGLLPPPLAGQTFYVFRLLFKKIVLIVVFLGREYVFGKP
jgi:hypothetical protein